MNPNFETCKRVHMDQIDKKQIQPQMEINSEVSIAEIPSHGDGYDSWMLTDENKNESKKVR